MLDSFFSKGIKASKCKTLLKLTVPRIKLLRNRRENQIKQMRREIAKFLETGQEGSARIRVENVIREEKMMAAQELVELFCELITACLPIIDAQKECPLDLKEAISSVCFAAPRCADLPELQQVQMLFAGKYGIEFVSSATELMPECGVNRQLVDLLSVRAPSPDVKLKLLKEIAKEHELDWDPSGSENELLKTHENLLDWSMQFVSDPKGPLPHAFNDEAKSTTSEQAAYEHSDSDEDFHIVDFPEVPRQQLQSNKDKKEDTDHTISTGQEEDKQFLPFIRPPSEPSVPFPLKENGSSPSITKTINADDADLQDVLAAAQAAAETAEGASAAARSASSLAQLRITELMKMKKKKKKNDDFLISEDENPFYLDKTKSDLEEEFELDAENPFARSNTSPGRNSTYEHPFCDARSCFGSNSQRDSAFSNGSLDQRETLSVMDDDTFLSYPNLFTSQGSR